jgi:ceramide glucosyltransferase
MIFIYFPFAALLIYLSYKSFRGGVNYLNYFKQELARPKNDFAPFATVIAPCKGLDEGLTENLNSLLVQDYPSYEVIFVVDDPSDAAAAVIEEIVCRAFGNAKLVVAPKAAASSQKVENLREAVLHADKRSRVFVFVDSDVRPGRDWLRSLVAPLADKTVGAATGYRWFISKDSTLAAELRVAWNASIASALGPNKSWNFCWGGSTAVRRDVFDRLNIRKRWHGTLSDDFAVTRAMRKAGLPIHFVPRAMVPSMGRCSAAGLFEFTNRQMKITRVYAQKLWLMSFFGSGIFNGVMVASFMILGIYSAGSIEWLAGLITLLLVTFFSAGKSWLRFKAIRLVLPSHSADLDRQFAYQITLWLLTPSVFLVNSVAAFLSTRINWRGTVYEMVSPTETRVLTAPSGQHH